MERYSKITRRVVALCLISLLGLFAAASLHAGEEDVIDFSDKMTPVCEVSGLSSVPPDGWFNVPIESDDPSIRGCQMMRAGEQQELVGILRLLSVDLPVAEDAPPWYAVMVAIEQQFAEAMGYVLGEVLWKRDEVPISGEGFSGARAIGLSASVEGSDIPQEAHFLVFERGDDKFIITLLTPAQSVDNGVYYDRNTADFGILIRNLKQKSG